MTPRRACLTIEFALLFFGAPLAYRLYAAYAASESERRPISPLPLLVLITAGCLFVLLRDRSFQRRRLWNARALRGRFRAIGLRFVVLAAVLATVVWFCTPDRWLGFVREHPIFWAIVMMAYPVVSVYPQGVVYRVFLFHRYRDLAPRPWAMIVLSAAAFSFSHIIFFVEPSLSMSLTFVGGLLFAWTYHRSSSALVASIEHALYGCLIFTIGWGEYFFHGAAR